MRWLCVIVWIMAAVAATQLGACAGQKDSDDDTTTWALAADGVAEAAGLWALGSVQQERDGVHAGGLWAMAHPQFEAGLPAPDDQAGGFRPAVAVSGLRFRPVDVNDELYGLVCAYAWDCEQAMRIMWCESRGDAGAVSPDGQNLGLFQINAVHRAKVGGDLNLLLDPEVNVRVAFAIYQDQGWGPWSCRP